PGRSPFERVRMSLKAHAFMPHAIAPLAVAAVAALAATAAATHPAAAAPVAGALQVVSSDARGVTLRFTLPPYRVLPVERPEGKSVRADDPGLRAATSVEARPVLPTEGGLVAFPANATPQVTVLDEETRIATETGGAELEPLGRHEFVPDGKDLEP